MGLWSNKLPSFPDNTVLADAVSEVKQRIKVVGERTFPTHAGLSEVYQGLTKPAEIPFYGDERTMPTFPALANLFAELDRIYGTDFERSFVQIGEDPSHPEDKPEDRKVSPSIRYLVENALVLGKWTVDGPPKISGRIIPNVYLYDPRGKQLTQFDGIIVREKSLGSDGDIIQRLGEGEPWAAIEIKVPNRARYISGKGKIGSVFGYDLSAYQHRLGKVILAKDGNFRLPTYILFAYLRGTLLDAIYPIKADSAFLHSWRTNLKTMVDQGMVHDEHLESVRALLGFLMGAESKALIQEVETRGRKEIEFSNGRWVQGKLFKKRRPGSIIKS
jgi:hypothetical protein